MGNKRTYPATNENTKEWLEFLSGLGEVRTEETDNGYVVYWWKRGNDHGEWDAEGREPDFNEAVGNCFGEAILKFDDVNMAWCEGDSLEAQYADGDSGDVGSPSYRSAVYGE